MAQFRSLSNTDKDYPCPNCTSTNVSIVREDPAGHNPRVRCNQCTFMFDATDSKAGVEAGEIKASSAEALASASEPEREEIQSHESRVQPERTRNPLVAPDHAPVHDVPDRPAYVFLSKPRGTLEFSTKRDFKSTAVRWHNRNFDMYELKKVSLNVKVDVS